MFTQLKKLFIDYCPECDQALTSDKGNFCCTKACPNGHYTEESYCHLGVIVVYKG